MFTVAAVIVGMISAGVADLSVDTVDARYDLVYDLARPYADGVHGSFVVLACFEAPVGSDCVDLASADVYKRTPAFKVRGAATACD